MTDKSILAQDHVPSFDFSAGHRSGHTTNEQHHLFYVLTSGVYPSLVVTDARCSGSLVGISKKQLWALFSLDR